MKFKKIILVTTLISTLVSTSGRTQDALAHPYSVDKQIDFQLNKFYQIDSGTLKNSMKIKVLEKTNTFFDQSLDCFTKSVLRNDTIYILGHMIGELGYGFELALFKDSCILTSFAFSDGKLYKYNASDTSSVDFISLASINQKVILSKKPAYQKGEVVAGFVKLKSIPFYYTMLKGKFIIELLAYFRIAPLDLIQ